MEDHTGDTLMDEIDDFTWSCSLAQMMLSQGETVGFDCTPGGLLEGLDENFVPIADSIKAVHSEYEVKTGPIELSEEDLVEGDYWDRSAWKEARVVRTYDVLDATGERVFSIGAIAQLWTESGIYLAKPDRLIVMIGILQEEVKDGKTEFFLQKYKK